MRGKSPQSWAEEVARDGLRWRHRAEELEDAVDEYLLWDPRRKGFAAAQRALIAVLRSDNEGGESDE